MSEMIFVPVPLEGQRVAQIQMPEDLTKVEAEKIARVVIAIAQEPALRALKEPYADPTH